MCLPSTDTGPSFFTVNPRNQPILIAFYNVHGVTRYEEFNTSLIGTNCASTWPIVSDYMYGRVIVQCLRNMYFVRRSFDNKARLSIKYDYQIVCIQDRWTDIAQ